MFCARLFICALWSPAGKGLTSWLSFVVSSVSLSLSHWYPGSGVVLDCIDSWSLHHYLLLSCLFVRKPVTVPGLGWQARTHLTRISKNNVVRIDWSVRSSDMSNILKWQFWTEGPTHNNGIKKPQAFRCSVAWDIDADPSASYHQYSEYAKPVIVLICHWLGTHSLLMKVFSSSKCDV